MTGLMDLPFIHGKRVGLINMGNHLVLLDYSNNTFSRFKDFDDLKEYTNTINKFAEYMKEGDEK